MPYWSNIMEGLYMGESSALPNIEEVMQSMD